jgi:hypothetical protein
VMVVMLWFIYELKGNINSFSLLCNSLDSIHLLLNSLYLFLLLFIKVIQPSTEHILLLLHGPNLDPYGIALSKQLI